MVSFLSKLEPISEEPNIIILNELDEENCIIFFQKGIYKIGYEINKI